MNQNTQAATMFALTDRAIFLELYSLASRGASLRMFMVMFNHVFVQMSEMLRTHLASQPINKMVLV